MSESGEGIPPSEGEVQSAEYPSRTTRDDVRQYLQLSTTHLPDRLSRHVNRCQWVLAWPHDLGAYIYVPANVQDLQETASNGCPAELLRMFRYAMELGCSLIDLVRDIEPGTDLPTYDGNKRMSAPGPSQLGAPNPELLNRPPPSPPGPPILKFDGRTLQPARRRSKRSLTLPLPAPLARCGSDI